LGRLSGVTPDGFFEAREIPAGLYNLCLKGYGATYRRFLAQVLVDRNVTGVILDPARPAAIPPITWETHRWTHGEPATETFGDLPEVPEPGALAWPFNHGQISRYTERLRADVQSAKPGVTPLMRAAASGDADDVRRQIAAGADPNRADSSGWTPLMYAATAPRAAALEALLQAGANPKAVSAMGQTALVAAVTSPRVGQLLMATLGAQMRGGRALAGPPDKAASFLNPLIAAGADVNGQSVDGFTALMLAREPEVVKLLLRARANPNARTAAGQTAAMLNAGLTDLSKEKLRLLLASGADINLQDRNGQTALMLLVTGKSPGTGDRPLESRGTDVKKLAEVVSIIRKAGGRTDIRDSAGRTVFERIAQEEAQTLKDLDRWASVPAGKTLPQARAKVQKWYAELEKVLRK
jgi:ankyrin repeat protein